MPLPASPLFSPFTNSPSSYLTAGITATDTTIPVADLAKFPTAPNIAVIGTGTDAETIYYAAKSASTGAGNLTGCIRAYYYTWTYGVAKAWLINEYIGRNFTSYDHISLLNNVNPMIPQGGCQNLALTKDNSGVERFFWKDDFSNNTIANYTMSGSSASIAAGIMSVPATGVAYHTLPSTCTSGKWDGVVEFTASGAGTEKLLLGDAGTSYVIATRIVTTNQIWLQLYIGGVSKIANTDTGVTLADSTFANISAVYDGTSWQMYWANVAVGANTAAVTVTTPIIGVAAGTIAGAWSELTFIPSTAHTDPYTSDTETRYMQLSTTDITLPNTTGTWAASAAGDVVIGAGICTLASDNDEAICAPLRSYMHASGEIEFSFDCNNDGGGGADSTGYVFCYQDILNHYKIVIEDDDGAGTTELLSIYKVVAGTATKLGTSKDVTTRYAKGTQVTIKLQLSRETGQMWAYLKDNTGGSSGLYPTTPDIADAFSTQFSYGKSGAWAAVTTAGAGNLNVAFYPATWRTALLAGDTNIPAYETGFYFRDEFSVDSIGRMNNINTATVTSAITGGAFVVTNAATDTSRYSTSSLTPQLSGGLQTIEYDFTMSDVSTANNAIFMGFVGSVSDVSIYLSGYELRVQATGSNNMYIERNDASTGAKTRISDYATKSINAAQSYHLKLEWDSTTGIINGYFDNEASPSVTATDATFTSGLRPLIAAKVNKASMTTTFDNLTISGTRYYMKPMLRGAQIGEYWDGTKVVPATRFVDDFNFDTSGEYTLVSGTASTWDTTNGYIIGGGSTGYYRGQQKYTDGYIQKKITLGSSTANRYPIIFRWENGVYGASYPTNAYIVAIRQSSGTVNIYAVDGTSVIATVGTATTTITAGKEYKLSALLVGTSIKVYIDDVLIIDATDSNFASGYSGFALISPNTIKDSYINALSADSTNGISVSPASVPHGGMYDSDSMISWSWTNLLQNGEGLLASRAKSTYPTTANFEYYFINLTDSTAINWDGQTTASLTPLTTYVDGVARILIRYQDAGDTLKIAVRRKNYSGVTYDNQPLVFINHLAFTPMWGV